MAPARTARRRAGLLANPLRALLGPPRLEREVLDRVTPSPAEFAEVREAGLALVQAANRVAEAKDWRAEAVLAGSVAKNTFLRSHVDLDCFLLFPTTLPRDELERRGLEAGEALLTDRTLRYAEHPYVRGRWKGHEADVVPAYKVADPAARLSAVDRTPFHTAYVMRHVRGSGRQEVRLVKQWLRGVGAYGAETARGGVSGYLAELLVVLYGSFPRALAAVEGWTDGTALTLLRAPPHPFDAPLVVIDPVDPRRNAASAVTSDTLARLRRAAAAYRAAPGLRFFFPAPPGAPSVERVAERLAARGETLVGIEVPLPKMREDAVVPHLRRIARSVGARLADLDLGVTGTLVEGGPGSESGLLAFRVSPQVLPGEAVHRGPPRELVSRVKDFRDKWTGHPDAAGPPALEGDRWFVRLRRAETRPRELVEALLPTWDLGRHVEAALGGGRPRVLGTGDLLAHREGPGVAEWVLAIDPWERPGEPALPPLAPPKGRGPRAPPSA